MSCHVCIYVQLHIYIYIYIIFIYIHTDTMYYMLHKNIEIIEIIYNCGHEVSASKYSYPRDKALDR